MQTNLAKGCDHYSLNKKYSCESYININLSWVGTEGGQLIENWKTSFPISSSLKKV